MGSRDLGLDVLLELNGETFAVDAEGKYLVRFIVRRVSPNPERPHGLSYSLTLHDETGADWSASTTRIRRPNRKDGADA